MSQQPPPGGERTPPEVISSLMSNAKSLVGQDMQLFKSQMSRTAAHGGKAAGAGGAAAVLMLFVVGFLGMAGGYALMDHVFAWAAWLIVAGVFALFALVAVLIARAQANRGARASKVATNQIKEDVQWAKSQLKR